MPRDYPSRTIPVVSHRDVQSMNVNMAYYVYSPAEPLQPGTGGYADIVTIPTGRRYFVSDCYGAMSCEGQLAVYIPGSFDIYAAFFEPYETHFASLSLPIPVESGETIRLYYQNTDTVQGTFRLLLGVYWEPGSPWIPPKKDEPLERFKTGDFNSASYFLYPDGSIVVIFRRHKEEGANYLRLQNPFKPNQKVLAEFKLKPNEAAEILDISHTQPDKLPKVLEKYEKKYAK
jgi:hypothetical protein